MPARAPNYLEGALADLPILAYPNGTRYSHPVPPHGVDPWPRDPRIAGEWLSEERMRVKLEQLDVYELPAAYVNATDEVWEHKRRGWEGAGLNRGEGFDGTGRPTKVAREVLYDGRLDGWRPRKASEPVELPRVQHASFAKDGRTAKEKEQDEQRRDWVKKAFKHLWRNYAEKAWGYDELKPLSGTGTNPFSGWGATIFDALDTLLIMGLQDEYLAAREHVARVDFSYSTPRNPSFYPLPAWDALPSLRFMRTSDSLHPLSEPLKSPAGVPTFETTIRYLGSLLAAYDLCGDPLMLHRARDLGDWLLPSMSTQLGLVQPTYRMGAHSDGGPLGTVCLAEVGSVGLEFLRLSQLTGDPVYFEAVQRSLDTLDTWPARDRIKGLFPTQIDTVNVDALFGTYTFGGQADSYYEYLIKLYFLLGGSPSSAPAVSEDPAAQYRRMYTDAIVSAHRHLVRDIKVVPGLEGAATIGDILLKPGASRPQSYYSPRLDHLTCFAGGMLGLGARLLDRKEDFKAAEKFTKACIWAYDATRTGLAPEIIELWSEKNPHRWEVVELEDIQRPETVESLFYLYRLTGDRSYQDKAWRMFTSWVEATINEGGFAHIDDVNSHASKQDDSGVESFVYGETLKYYYLIFSEPDVLSLDDWCALSLPSSLFTVFHHVNSGLMPASSPPLPGAPFWLDRPPLTMPDAAKIGRGTPVQKWARMVQAAAMRGWHWTAQ
ncbi:hypothetical protein JCM10213v2_006953 [Rhodosporidiobolus nylandii]